MKFTLRNYQEDSVDALFSFFEKRNGNPLLVLPTGGGKSVVQAAFIERAIGLYPNTRIVLASHVKELLQQNAEKIIAMCPGLNVRFCSAGIGEKRFDSQILVAGIQTAYKHADKIGHVDLLMVDECHLIPDSSDTMYRTFIDDLLKINPRMKVIGMTATPYRLSSGLMYGQQNSFFSGVAHDVPIAELLRQGHLTRLVGRRGITHVDLSNLHTRCGDFIEKELQERFDIDSVTQNIVKEVVATSEGMRGILMFSSGVDHAHHLAEAIGAVTQERVEVVSGGTPRDERERIIADYKAQKYRWLINYGVLCLDQETEILTSEGFVGRKDMTMKHKVACWNMDGSIYFKEPRFIIDRQRMEQERMVVNNKKMYNIRVTDKHRMVYKTGKNLEWKEDIAENLVEKRIYVPISGQSEPLEEIVEHKTVSHKKRASRIRSLSYVYRKRDKMSYKDARMAAEAEVDRRLSFHPKPIKELTIDECMFIGFWLGDGTLSNNRCEFSQSKTYPHIIEWFDNILNNIGIPCSRHNCSQKSNGSDYILWSVNSGRGSKDQARHSGYYKYLTLMDKNGSDKLWCLNENQFDALLYGFWMADGNHRNGRNYKNKGRIVGTQIHLYNKLQEVATCRGYSTYIVEDFAKNNKVQTLWQKPQFKFSFSKKSQSLMANDKMSIEDTPYTKENVWCVTSDSSYIITRRSGRVVITGNTTGFDAPHVDLMVLCRATQSTGLYVQMCLDTDTEILTGRGWLNCDEISLHDKAVTFDLETGKGSVSDVLDITYRKLLESESFYSIQSPRLDIRVTDSHDMVFATRTFRPGYSEWKKATASEVSNICDRYIIPASSELCFHGVDLTEDELKFVGLFLSDGTLNKTNNAVTIYQSEVYPDIINEIRETIKACGMKFGESMVNGDVCFGKKRVNAMHRFTISKGTPRGRDSHLSGWGHLEKYIDKDLSPLLMECTKEQFDTLLRAIHLGDGAKSKVDYVRRSYQISTGNKKFADRLQICCITRGYPANIKTITNNRKNNLYLINITKNFSYRTVGGKNKQDRSSFQCEGYSDEHVWCIKTNQGTIVTRRNGKVAVLGNCGRGMRVSPNKQKTIVLDYGGNIERHGPIDRVRPHNPKSGSGEGEAPIKECPECLALLYTAVRECPECGHEFPAPEPELEQTASNAAILSEDAYEWWDVCHVEYRRHQKQDKPDSMRVVYHITETRSVSEWVCFSHEGYARRKAEQWSARRGQVPPAGTDEALDIEWPSVARVHVDPTGQYAQLLDVEFGEPAGEIVKEEKPTPPPFDTTGLVDDVIIDEIMADCPF